MFARSLFWRKEISARSGEIHYSVVALLSQDEAMAVEVDNAVYILQLQKPSSILYSGRAPIAKYSYRYVKVDQVNYRTSPESFYRHPETESTVNEFYNRTWNRKEIGFLPQVYDPLPIVNRIETELHKRGEIPSIHLVAKEEEVELMHNEFLKDIVISTNMSYVSLKDSLFYDKVELSLAGQIARYYTKYSYSITLSKKDNIYGYRSIKLRSLESDPSYIREHISHDMLHSLGLPASKFSYCRLFINNHEVGLYGLIEPFQDPWTANEFSNGNRDYVSGMLYQGSGRSPNSLISDLSYMHNLTAYADGQYKIKAGEENNFRPLQKLTKFIEYGPTQDEDSAEVWNYKLDMDTVIRAMVLEVLNGYSNGYLERYHNFYLYLNPETENFIYISSDLDTTLGYSITDMRPKMTGNYMDFPGVYERPLMVRLLQIKEFRREFERMILHVAECLVNPEATNDYIDDLVEMIYEDVMWDHSVPRLGQSIRKVASFLHIPLVNGRIPKEVNLAPILEIAAKTFGPMLNSVLGPIGAGSAFDLADIPRAIDAIVIIAQGADFIDAVNGPTGHPSTLGVREFIGYISSNVLQFYRSYNYEPYGTY
ncbi:coth protein-domain-containing protein [Sporodiniella umbellata]|nr:coth protein-domain-containing protein [Sporodiniella umbellata]